MEDKELMVTIPLETYDLLKRGEIILDVVDDLVNECINNAKNTTWDKEHLECSDIDIAILLKYMNKAGYEKKLEELKNNE